MKKSKIKRLSAMLMSIILIIGLSTTPLSAYATDYIGSEPLPIDGTPVNTGFYSIGENKYYKIVLEEDGRLDINLSNLTPGSSINLTLHNENFSYEYTDIGNYILDNPKTFSEGYYLYKGTYYAKVEYTFKQEQIETANCEISASFTSANSNVITPIESSDNAMNVEANIQYSTILEERKPKNYYILNLNEGTDLTFVVNPSNRDLVLRIFNNDLAKISDYWWFTSLGNRVSTKLEAGTYYLEFGSDSIMYGFSNPCIYSYYFYETEKGDPFAPTEPDTEPVDTKPIKPVEPDTNPTIATEPTTNTTTIPTKSTDPTSVTKNATSDTPSNGSINSNSSNGAVQTGVISVTIALTLVILISGSVFFFFKKRHKIG